MLSRSSLAEPSAQALVEAARDQIGQTLIYDPRYQQIDYPMGDVPIMTGVCTDVVIRAFRALDIDLQQKLHEDMRANFNVYPNNWGLSGPDSNIDHRRVPNLATWFKRQGTSLKVSDDPADYQPGDLVTWVLDGGRPHVGIVSDRRSSDEARPLILHNIGWGAAEDDVLFAFEVTGHYRYFQ